MFTLWSDFWKIIKKLEKRGPKYFSLIRGRGAESFFHAYLGEEE